ncbi:hypothetical protein [Sphingobium aquiterrae]|uniref:hypothetical protein n=1 Tax=Sphingobium aquiterrae TaxID=2038656 RepID=UPI003016C12B
MRRAMMAIAVAGMMMTISHEPVVAAGTQEATSADGPLKVESYYRVKWGGMSTFLRSYRAQRLALLTEMRRQGFISDIVLEMPFTHMAGGPRWDVRITITYAHGADGMGVGARYKAAMAAAKARMFPDLAAFDAVEAERAAQTEEHWDVAIEPAP